MFLLSNVVVALNEASMAREPRWTKKLEISSARGHVFFDKRQGTRSVLHGSTPAMQGAVRYPGVFLRLNFGSPCRETQKRNEKSQPLPANPALPPPTTAVSGGTSKGHAPHCTPKTAISTPLHLSPSTRLDESLVASTGLRWPKRTNI
jgi:hypothetical protein